MGSEMCIRDRYWAVHTCVFMNLTDIISKYSSMDRRPFFFRCSFLIYLFRSVTAQRTYPCRAHTYEWALSLGHPSLTRLSSFFLMLFHCFLTHFQGLSGFVLCWFVVQEVFLIFAVNCTFGLSLHPHYRGFFITGASSLLWPRLTSCHSLLLQKGCHRDLMVPFACRPSLVRSYIFHSIYLLHLPQTVSHPQLLRFALYGTLVSVCGLICDSCSSGRNFASRLLSELLLPVSPLP